MLDNLEDGLMVFIEIPLIVILVLILLLIGGLYQIVTHIGIIIIYILFAAIDLGLFALMMKVYYKAHDKVRGIFFGINLISICIFWFYGLFVFVTMRDIDTQGLKKYMTFLGTNENSEVLRYLIFPVVIVLCFYLAALLAAYIMDNKKLKSVFCILPILLTLLFYNVSSNICTESYSQGKVEEFMQIDSLEKYTLSNDVKVYYPVYGTSNVKRVLVFPGFIPFNYSRISFTQGETIFLKTNVKPNIWGTKHYVEASNGKEVGIINIEDVKGFSFP